MFSIFKKSKKNKKFLEGLINTFFFPPLLPFGDIKPVDYKEVSVSTKEKILLFSYGIMDCFFQAARISEKEANEIMNDMDSFFEQNVGMSLIGFMGTDNYKKAFDDSELLKVIEIGGKTYSDFASEDKTRGGQSITRLTSLVSIWERV